MTQAEHAELINAIQLHYSRGDTRLLKAIVGRGWTGKIIFQDRERIILSPYRPFHGMPEGVLDLIGFTGPTFVALEGKTGSGRLTVQQKSFIELVQRSGGRAGEVRSVEDARRILEGK